ncbi:MAG: phosphatidylserine decarboxylase family protein [Desulfamplus sp.]|nr:phosphatidylserine decarboxylase family protein [Desulfamplus sp.]MBF0413041.1 phosphatidylserine decarboxylase family protein [Desulfamplus sp.]
MNKTDWPYNSAMPIAAPGLKFIITSITIAVLLFLLGWTILGCFALFITVFICWFFRDPERAVPDSMNCLVSPADGKIIVVEEMLNNDFTHQACIKVSIFMNVFNVHVNRIPFKGVVENIIYVQGKFINASFDKASEHNERNALVIRTDSGLLYGVVQIAGLIARRIISNVDIGDSVERGSRYGMICFGSRLDLYLPSDSKIAVANGQKVEAGTTIIAYLN